MAGFRFFRPGSGIAVVAAILGLGAAAHAAPEKRCGWLANPTPGNWWLNDRDGEWLLAEQGGYQAKGMDDMPDMSSAGWVETNGPHGYGCACLTVETDRAKHRISRVIAATPLPLARCKADRSLANRRPDN